ncbi:MAG: hypothetical protein R3F37_16905 [Candidatus Competibacteraceae bacterium]
MNPVSLFLLFPSGRRGRRFPDEPNSGDSGFGVTINYVVLGPGVHAVSVEIEDSSGALRTFTSGVLVRQPAIRFSGEFEASNSTTWIAGNQWWSRMPSPDHHGQSATRTLRYQWDVPSQAFLLSEESVAEVTITSAACAK